MVHCHKRFSINISEKEISCFIREIACVNTGEIKLNVTESKCFAVSICLWMLYLVNLEKSMVYN